MEFYISILDKDCQPHYFMRPENAMEYLKRNVDEANCRVEPNSISLENGEIWNERHESLGCFYKIKTED